MVLRRLEGTVMWIEEDDLREREEVAVCRRADRYGGARCGWL